MQIELPKDAYISIRRLDLKDDKLGQAISAGLREWAESRANNSGSSAAKATPSGPPSSATPPKP
jgi:hypothetical protein